MVVREAGVGVSVLSYADVGCTFRAARNVARVHGDNLIVSLSFDKRRARNHSMDLVEAGELDLHALWNVHLLERFNFQASKRGLGVYFVPQQCHVSTVPRVCFRMPRQH
jgi:hypothetical protein